MMPTVKKYPRRFILRRWHDVSGVSGSGDVATGALFDSGIAVVHWGGENPTTTTHIKGLSSIEAINGHNGLTEIVWIDPEEEDDATTQAP